MTPSRRLFWVLLVAGGVASATTPAEPPRVREPARPETVEVHIRYRIRADRDERIRQFRALERHLAGLGFVDARKDDPDRELEVLDPTAERLNGTIPSARVLDILDDPRVQTILFAPPGYPYPDTGQAPVPVRVVLRSGLLPNEQQLLHAQVLGQLERLGFREALGYDTRGYTQLKGFLPYRNLSRLVRDLREEPAGWFLPDVPPERLPRPLADRNPVRWVEVMPPASVVPPYEPPAVPPVQARLTPDLRAVLADPARRESPVRVDVLFARPLEGQTDALRSRLAVAFPPSPRRGADGNIIVGPDGLPVMTEGATLEGAIGNLAVIRFDRPADVERFAAEPDVLSIRLPREAAETVAPIPAPGRPAPAADVLRASGLQALHERGYTGRGVKVVVLGTDFTGAEALIGSALPNGTRIVDLTSELNSDVRPLPGDPRRAGLGTGVARTVARAVPDAELVLVRVDPGSLFQLADVLRSAGGEAGYSEAMRSRLAALARRSAELTRRKTEAVEEYRKAFGDATDDAPAAARRDRAKRLLDTVIAEQAELRLRVERFNALQKATAEALAGARVVINTLVWESGYPLDGLSDLARTLDRLATPLPPRVVRPVVRPADAPRPPVVWVQAASTAGPAVWGGPFIDANGDGMLEFAPPDAPLPPDNWNRGLNFLGLHVPDGTTSPELPAGTRLRFVMQWREPLDPNLPSVDRPLFPVVLRVFRQIDPAGEKIPSDEMAEVARSAGGPYPLLLTETLVVYEQILEFVVPEAGRYALVVAKGYEPEALLPGLKRQAEIYPRVVIETLSAQLGGPRVVFRSFVTPQAGVGLPADATGAVTVGVPRAGELTGGGTGLALRSKPDLYGPESVEVGGPPLRGTGIAAGYVGGLAAALVQAGAAGPNVFCSAGFAPGQMAVVPGAWLANLRPARRP